MLTKICLVCSSIFKTYKEKQKTCSKICMGVSQKGSNNPNFGNKWSDDAKKAHGDLVKSKVDDEYRKKAGSANKGVKFSKDRIAKMHDHRSRESYVHYHSEEAKKQIGKKSKAKFTEEYRIRVRKTLVNCGKATPDSKKHDFTVYQQHAGWIHRMWDLVENSTLLETVGIFNSFTNKNGCERDHKFSKMSGFNEGVFPEILRHPANCQLLTHSENSSKREKSSITKKELFTAIRSYNKQWQEQDLVLDLITRYESGERFIANNYRRE